MLGWSLQPGQPHVFTYLILGCKLQPSYQTAIYAPDSSGAVFLGLFFNLHIIRGKNLYGYEAEVPEMQHLCQRTVIIFCTGPCFEYLALSPSIPPTFFTFRPRLQWNIGRVNLFWGHFLLPYTPGVFRNVPGRNETAVSLKEKQNQNSGQTSFITDFGT